MTKTIIIGMTNPQGNQPLDPFIPGSAGWRLWNMIHFRNGITPEQYLEHFERLNMLRDREWNMQAAKAAAPDLWNYCRGRTVLLLGAQVVRALGMPESPWMVWQVRYGARWAVLPHPSGRNRWYNNPAQRERAGEFLEDLYRGHIHTINEEMEQSSGGAASAVHQF